MKTEPSTMNDPKAEEQAAPVNEELLTPTADFDLDEALEAILFAAGHAVTYAQLGNLFEIPVLEMKARVLEYAHRYNEVGISRGVILLTYDEACQLCTKPSYLPYIRAALGIRKNGNLSNSSIETLAIIAYNQPVTRSYIDQVRKVESSYAVNNLIDRGLIEAKGRLDAPGRPMLFGTTPDFLRCFGLSSLADLPDIHTDEATEMLMRMGRQLMMDTDENQVTIDTVLVEDGAPTTEDTTEE
ncbi:MAG: SMC-Scp complex subunit ScpB [Clostridia bacterium]|nr:SMC-Scp complex subunit ScpB [Clostridia bacterium]